MHQVNYVSITYRRNVRAFTHFGENSNGLVSIPYRRNERIIQLAIDVAVDWFQFLIGAMKVDEGL